VDPPGRASRRAAHGAPSAAIEGSNGLMDLKLHANATTTPRPRGLYSAERRPRTAPWPAELRPSNSRTVARWKARQGRARSLDLPASPGPRR